VVQLDGKTVLLSLGAKAGYGYDPANGDEFFRVEERTSHSVACRPFVFRDLIIFTTASPKVSFWRCIRGGSQLPRASWTPTISLPPITIPMLTVSGLEKQRNVLAKPSVQLSGELLFMVDESGTASCLEAATEWRCGAKRISNPSNYSASPVLADGRVYFFTEEGKVNVVQASRDFKIFPGLGWTCRAILKVMGRRLMAILQNDFRAPTTAPSEGVARQAQHSPVRIRRTRCTPFDAI